ncbi:chromobox protein homolog 3 isoform X1 [Heliangelus exortis]|uniref:chromobox protein homolog 3 isoform X1 n=1 Tax=Heliangelus exortis TaxID=472823 RepID=UPI003A91CC0E
MAVLQTDPSAMPQRASKPTPAVPARPPHSRGSPEPPLLHRLRAWLRVGGHPPQPNAPSWRRPSWRLQLPGGRCGPVPPSQPPPAHPVAFSVAARHLPSFGRLTRSCASPPLERRLGPPPCAGGDDGRRLQLTRRRRRALCPVSRRRAVPGQPSPSSRRARPALRRAAAQPLPTPRLPPSFSPFPHPPPQPPSDVAVAAAAQCAQGESEEETGDTSGWAPLNKSSASLQ